MKKYFLRKLLFSNHILLIISLVIGYSLWHIATVDQTIIVTVPVPVCFTDHDQYSIIEAPETITLLLQGKRSDLYLLDKTILAAHIDSNKLLPGKNNIILNEHNFFLPQSVSLLRYKPKNLSISVKTTV